MPGVGRWLRLVWVFALIGLSLEGQAQQSAATVAVFEEDRFPRVQVPNDITPQIIRNLLGKAGIRSEAVNSEALGDPARFNAQKYKVLVWTNGSAFPKAAAENLRHFHASGGCIVANGVPFSRPFEIPQIAGVPRWGVAAPERSVVRVERHEAHAGQFSVFVSKQGGEWAGLSSSRLACEPGKAYRLSAWVKTGGLGSSGNRLCLRFYDVSGKSVSQVDFPLPPSAEEWIQIIQEITAPVNAEAMDVCLQVATPKGVAWLDDVHLEPVESGQKEPDGSSWVPDAGFELFAKAGWRDLGSSDEYVGHDQIGVGSSQIIYDCTGFAYSPQRRDPVGLRFLKWSKPARGHLAQFLDPGSLPKEDVVIGLVAAYQGKSIAGYPVALIKHNCPQFRGATDIWIGPGHGRLLARPKAEQMILLSVAYLLSEQRLLTKSVYDHTVRLARKLSAPKPQDRLARKYPVVQETSPYTTVYPRANPPEQNLLIFNVSRQPLSIKLMVAALQGLVNREKPLVYIEDGWWAGLKDLGFQGQSIPDPYQLIARFQNRIKGLVIYDPDFPATLNIALTMAGLNDVLPVSPDLAVKLQNRFQLEARDDLRGRWKTDAEAYRWALQNLLPRCSHFLLAHQKQAEPLAPENIGPSSAAIAVDYLVQHKVFSFHLNRRPTPEELHVADDILGALPPNIPVMGRMGPNPVLDPDTVPEWELISRLSGFGKFFLYGIPPNLSVHSGIQPPASLMQSSPRKLPLEKDKVYVSFLCSEGDSLWFWYGMKSRANGWGNEGRGKVPVGWEVTPALLDLAPAVLLYHYRTASGLDCFLTPVSGIGYIYPELYGIRYNRPQEVFEGFLQLTGRYMKMMDLHIVRPHQAGGTTNSTYARYARVIENLSALFPDYGRRSGIDYANANYLLDSKVPVFHCLITLGGDDTRSRSRNIDSVADEIRAIVGKDRPAFVHALLRGWVASPQDVEEVAAKLGSGFILVRPDEMAGLFKAAQGE